jgi:carboxypeptidase family protein
VVTKGGYVDATNAQRRPLGTAQRIDVTQGQRITGIEVRMWKYAVIAGTVVDEAGEPVVGARVRSFRRTFAPGGFTYGGSASTATDDRGMYRIANLAPGEYLIAVEGTSAAIPMTAMTQGVATTRLETDRSLLVYPTIFYPASTTSGQASAVTIGAGEERAGVDVRIQPFRAVSVSGSILAPDGYLDRIPLRLIPAQRNEVIGELETAATTSNPDGSFSFPAIPPGEYELKAIRMPRPPAAAPDPGAITVVRSGSVIMAAPRPPATGRTIPQPIPADATLFGYARVAVGDAEVSGVTLPLRAGPRVSGLIEFDGLAERPDTMTLANLRITLDPADGSALPDQLRLVTGRADESGRFRTYGVPPGKYFVRVGGIANWYLRGAVHEGRDLADFPIELTTDDVSGVVLTFTDSLSSIAGTIRDGQSVDRNAVALAFPLDRAMWGATGNSPRRMRTARADEDGSYLFPSLPAGDYYVVAVRETFEDEWMDPGFLESIAGAAEQVRLAEGERKTQDLRTMTLR